jgi:hypothetical protein
MTVWIVAGFSRADLFRQAGAVLRNRIRHSGTIFSSDGCTADGWSYGLRRNLRETGEYWAAAHFCSTRSWQQIATVLGGAAYDSGFWASISNTLCFFLVRSASHKVSPSLQFEGSTRQAEHLFGNRTACSIIMTV